MIEWITSLFQPIREAYGVYIDPDEDEWRPLSGDGLRDLLPVTQDRMQELAVYLWERNLLANRLIELPVAFLLAEGVSLKVRDKTAQGWIDAFWNDPITNMPLKLERKVREMAIFGEQVWPAFVSPNGHVRLGYLDPHWIAHVITDPDNADQPIGIVTKANAKGQYKKYRVIVNGGEDVFTERTQRIRAEDFPDGECFYFAINQLSGGRRGRSDLLAAADWCDAYGEFLYGELERTKFLRDYVWDVTLVGASPEETEARAKKITRPKPGTTRVHNDREVWQALTPDLKGEDNDMAARLFRNHVLGGATIPEHWYGGGGESNRAVAAEMYEPTWKMMTSRQTLWGNILMAVGTYVVRRRLEASGEMLDLENPDPDLKVSVRWPEITWRDTSKFASGLQQAATGLALMLDKGVVSDEFAAQIMVESAKRFGVVADAEELLAQARKDLAKRREEVEFEVTDRERMPAED